MKESGNRRNIEIGEAGENDCGVKIIGE